MSVTAAQAVTDYNGGVSPTGNPYTIVDTAANIGASFASLFPIDLVSDITSLTFSDSSPGTMSYTLTGVVSEGFYINDILNTHGTPNANVTLDFSGTATNLLSAASNISSFNNLPTIMSDYAGVNFSATGATATQAGLLVSDYGSATSLTMTVSDTIANLVSSASTLNGDASYITTIATTDTVATQSQITSLYLQSNVWSILNLSSVTSFSGTVDVQILDFAKTKGFAGTSGTYTISDVASNLAAASSTDINNATSVTVTGAAAGANLATLATDNYSNISFSGVSAITGTITAATATYLLGHSYSAASTMPISDTVANISAQMTTLLANVGQIQSVTFTDASPVTFTYAVTGSDGAALESFLGLVNTNANVTLSLTGTETNLINDYNNGLTLSGIAAKFAAIDVTASATFASAINNMATLFSGTTLSMAVVDTAANVGTNLNTMIGHVSSISSVTLTDASAGTVSYTDFGSGGEGAGLQTLLGKFATNSNVTFSLSGTAAHLEANSTNGLTFSGIGSKFAAIHVTASAALASDVATLVTDYGSVATLSIAVSDSAANISTNLDSLQTNNAKVTSITVSPSAAVSVSYAQLTSDSGALNKIVSGTLAVTGVAAGNVATVLADTFDSGAVTVASVTVSDTAANVQSAFSTLVTDAADISSITLSDSSPATLSYTVTGSDGAALASVLNAIVPNSFVTLELSGTAAHLLTDNTDGLNTFNPVGFAGASVTATGTITGVQAQSLVDDFAQGLVLTNFSSTDIAALDPATEFAQLTSTQIASLTTTQLAGLSAADLAALDPTTQLAGFSSTDIKSLTTTQLTGLSSTELSLLDPATQLNGLTSTQIASLDAATQLNGLSSTEVAALTTTQFAGFSSTDIASFDPMTQLSGISTTDIAAFTTTQVAGLSSFDLSGISSTLLGAMSSAQFAALTTTQISGFTSTSINALTTTQLAGFSSVDIASLDPFTQLNGLSSTDIASLTTTQIAGISSIDIATLDLATQLNGLTSTEIGALTTTQLAGYSSTDLGALDPSTQLNGLTSAQIASLDPTTQINGLTSTEIAALTTTQVKGFSSVDVASLDPATQLNGMSAADLSALSSTQLSGLTTAEVQSLDATTQIGLLTPAGLNAFSTTDLESLTTTQVAALTPGQIGGLSTTNLAALELDNTLTTTQLSGLIPVTVAGLTSTQLGALLSTELGQLPGTQVAAITTTQIAGLTSTELGAMDPVTQFAFLSSSDIKALTTTQLTGLTSAEIAVLDPTTQLNGLSSLDLKSFSTTLITALTSTQIASLSTTQLSGFSSTDVSFLSSTQISGLNAADVKSLTTTEVKNLTSTQISGLNSGWSQRVHHD